MAIDYKLDKSNAVKVHELFPEACRQALESARKAEINYQVPRDVLIIGMGGSAIGGDLLKEWLPNVDISVSRSYDIPSWVGKQTLVIASSYSGNTAETLSALNMAIENEAMIVGLSSGGKLEKKSKERFPLISLPTGYQPRYAISHSFFSLVGILEKTGLISKSMEIDTALDEIQKFKEELKHTASSAKNPAKALAKKIGSKMPLIYSSEPLNSVGLRMKAEFNENSKIPSFSNSFPELNHNEIMGWASDLSKNFFSIFLRHQFESDEISKRIAFTKSLIKKKTGIYEFKARGTTKLSQMMTTLYFGDFTSIYLALINGVDPTPVKEIEALKKYLSN